MHGDKRRTTNSGCSSLLLLLGSRVHTATCSVLENENVIVQPVRVDSVPSLTRRNQIEVILRHSPNHFNILGNWYGLRPQHCPSPHIFFFYVTGFGSPRRHLPKDINLAPALRSADRLCPPEPEPRRRSVPSPCAASVPFPRIKKKNGTNYRWDMEKSVFCFPRWGVQNLKPKIIFFV